MSRMEKNQSQVRKYIGIQYKKIYPNIVQKLIVHYMDQYNPNKSIIEYLSKFELCMQCNTKLDGKKTLIHYINKLRPKIERVKLFVKTSI